MRSRSIDLTESMINIDTLLDVYVQTQRDNGADPGLEECEITIDNDGEMHIEKPKHKEEDKCSGSCKSCNGSCHSKESSKNESEEDEKPWLHLNKLGLFEDCMSSELEQMDDDDGETYVCEYCSDIGFRKEYKPYICDTCNICETCVEFENGECSGCGYSIYPNGKPYSALLAENGDDSYIDDEERQLLLDLSSDVETETSVRKPDFSFTVLDHDHKY